MTTINNIGNDDSVYIISDNIQGEIDEEVCMGKIKQLTPEEINEMFASNDKDLPEWYKKAFVNGVQFRQADGSTLMQRYPQQVIEGEDYLWLIYPGSVSDTHNKEITEITDNIERSRISYSTLGVQAIRKRDLKVITCIDPISNKAVQRFIDPKDQKIRYHYVDVASPLTITTWKPGWHSTKNDDDHVGNRLLWYIDTQTPTGFLGEDTYYPFKQEEPFQIFGHPYNAYPVVMRLPVTKNSYPHIYSSQAVPQSIECLVLVGGFLKNGFLENKKYRNEHASYAIRIYTPTPVREQSVTHGFTTIVDEILTVSVFRNTVEETWKESVLHSGIGTGAYADGNTLYMHGGLRYTGNKNTEYQEINVSAMQLFTKIDLEIHVDSIQTMEPNLLVTAESQLGSNQYLLRAHPKEGTRISKCFTYEIPDALNYGDEVTGTFKSGNWDACALLSLYPYMFKVGNNIVSYGSIGLDSNFKTGQVKTSFPISHDLLRNVNVVVSIPYLWMCYVTIHCDDNTAHIRPLNISRDVGALEGMCPIKLTDSKLLLMGGLDANRGLLGKHYDNIAPFQLLKKGVHRSIRYAVSTFLDDIMVGLKEADYFGYQPGYSLVIDDKCASDKRQLHPDSEDDDYYKDCATPFAVSNSTMLYDCWYADVIPFPEKNRWLLWGSMLNEKVFPLYNCMSGEQKIDKYYLECPPVTMIQKKPDLPYKVNTKQSQKYNYLNKRIMENMDVLSGELVFDDIDAEGLSNNEKAYFPSLKWLVHEPQHGEDKTNYIGHRLGQSVIVKDATHPKTYWLMFFMSDAEIKCYKIDLGHVLYANETKNPESFVFYEKNIMGTDISKHGIMYQTEKRVYDDDN